MANRSFPATVGWTLAIVVAGTILAVNGCTSAPAPQPETSPVATTLTPERAPDVPVASAPTTSEAASAAPVAPAAAPPAAASPSASPSPDPAEAQRLEQEQRLRAEIAVAKARAEALAAQVNAECPDLKPGELRHPGAAARCTLLKDQAAEAARQYELGKKEAAAAGIVVP